MQFHKTKEKDKDQDVDVTYWICTLYLIPLICQKLLETFCVVLIQIDVENISGVTGHLL